MVFCKGCGKEIHETATACLGCGAEQNLPKKRSALVVGGLAILYGFVFFLVFYFCLIALNADNLKSKSGDTAEFAGAIVRIIMTCFFVSFPTAAVLCVKGKLPGTHKKAK